MVTNLRLCMDCNNQINSNAHPRNHTYEYKNEYACKYATLRPNPQSKYNEKLKHNYNPKEREKKKSTRATNGKQKS